METLIETYKNHILNSLSKANNYESKITTELINMYGMTGKKTRHFYNNLLNFVDARYLEIGVWKGSSVCSAMYKNKASITCIDNWSEFENPRNEFYNNINNFKGENIVSIFEEDCFNIDISKLSKFNIYMYDGAHTYDAHYKALTYFYNCLDDLFILIIDDWNWDIVRNGTIDAIKNLNLNIIYEEEIRLTYDNSHTNIEIAKETWWNGIYIALLQKNN